VILLIRDPRSTNRPCYLLISDVVNRDVVVSIFYERSFREDECRYAHSIGVNTKTNTMVTTTAPKLFSSNFIIVLQWNTKEGE